MSRSVDELLHHWPAVLRLAENEWAKSFATSIARQARRPRWKPTAKQEALMRRLVDDLFAHAEGEDFQLIE